jgi:hypothetical protein
MPEDNTLHSYGRENFKRNFNIRNKRPLPRHSMFSFILLNVRNHFRSLPHKLVVAQLVAEFCFLHWTQEPATGPEPAETLPLTQCPHVCYMARPSRLLDFITRTIFGEE